MTTYSKELSANYELQEACAALLNLPERKRFTKTKKGISVGIRNLVYYKDKLYLQMEIKNKSGIDFDVNELQIAKIQGNKNKKASYQEILMKPIYQHQVPDNVRHGDTAPFVLVLPKFTLAEKEKVKFSLLEEQGSRLISFSIKKMR